jgi:c-di-GMP-binding flagellar brake protein YcgR
VLFKSLFRVGAKTKSLPEEKLPVLHSFVDVTVMGRSARSVSVEEVGPDAIVVGDVVGRAGERAVFVYQSPAGKFRFGATVLHVKDGMTSFKMPERIEMLGGGAQKRSSVRMDVLIAGMWRLTNNGKGTGEFLKGNIRDISRGGCALILDRPCKVGQLLEIKINLRADAPPLTVLGEVMRVETVQTSGKHSHGLRFQGLTPDEGRTILEFINKKQADLRNRGLA